MAFQKITESESLYDNLDQMSVRELLEGINNEDLHCFEGYLV